MKRILREPLLHFFLIGFGLFVVYGLVNRSNAADSDNTIVVSSGRIEQLATVFGKTWQRPPTAVELKGLIDDFVLEEIYFRQAVAMQMDRDDTIIRRRLRQKLEFLTDDTSALVDPSEKELAEYLAANEQKFRQSPTYSFDQVYFNPEKHGDDPESEVSEMLSLIRTGKDVGDASLLPSSYDLVERNAVDGTFGTGFSSHLDDLEIGEWQGPIRSGLGIHLVRLKARTEGRLPELSQIREIVEREWRNEQRVSTRKKMNDRLLQDYEVEIQWPDDFSDQPSPKRQTQQK